MRPFKYFAFIGALLCPLASNAGLVSGTLTLPGDAPAANVRVEIRCGDAVSSGSTNAHGQYTIQVPQQGQCTLAVPNYGNASAVVFSKQNPSTYNFQLVQPPGQPFELRAK